jgi:ferredoxin
MTATSGGESSGYVAGWNRPSPRGGVMRVVVDFDLCESNAVCMGIAPEVFEVRDDDFLYVLQEEPDESLRAKVEESVARCPKQAISIEG